MALQHEQHVPSHANGPTSIIVADDDKSVRLVIAAALKKQGYIVHTAATAAGMWDLSVARRGALLITDVGFPDGDALDMLPRLQSRLPELKVIVMSARANLLTAVQSRQRGVIDYLPKPFELKQLIETTQRALSQEARGIQQKAPIETPNVTYAPLLGRSAIMQDVYKNLAFLSTQIVPVLIQAEPGSSKTEVARALHDMSGMEAQAYCAVNCAQIPPHEHETHLFGPNGAIAQAHGGTLFINNIELLSSAAQWQFVRLIEAHRESHGTQMSHNTKGLWPKRVLMGSRDDLRRHVDADDFREDLFFAISVAPLKLPPLRNRRQDIPAMANHFCTQANESFNTAKSLSLSALSALQEYEWPGNIKELHFIIRRLVMSVTHDQIEAHDVHHALGTQKQAGSPEGASSLTEAADLHIRNYFDALGDNMPPTGLYDRILEEVERPLIVRTLHLTKGNQIKAAQILGLNRNTLRKKIDLLTISKNRSDYKE